MGEYVRKFAGARSKCRAASFGLGQMLDQHTDDRVADRAHDRFVVERGRIGTQVAQPRIEGVFERVRGLEERTEYIVVTVNGFGQEGSP